MRSFIVAASSLLALATAAPSPTLLEKRSSCLTNAEATEIANVFRDTIALPFNTTLVKEAFVPGFQDYSDSVNELINSGCPSGAATLTAPTFPSRAAFITGQSGQQPIPFEILNIWNNCEEVTLRWRSSNPAGNTTVRPIEVVTGIIAIEVVANPGGAYPFQIQTVYSEFNSGAWLYDLGIFTPSCS